jgi:hypothetical protein
MSVGEPEPLSDLSVKEQEPPVDLSVLPVIGLDDDVDQVPVCSRTFYAIMLGTVASAVNDYVRYKDETKPKAVELARNARAWLFCRTDPCKDPVLGSFQWVCMVLDKDADSIRMRISQMKIRDLPKVDRRSQ